MLVILLLPHPRVGDRTRYPARQEEDVGVGTVDLELGWVEGWGGADLGAGRKVGDPDGEEGGADEGVAPEGSEVGCGV